MDIKEVSHLVISIVLFAFVISFLQGIEIFAIGLLIAFVILGVNVLVKEFVASSLDAKIENKIWHLQRWGWYERSYFKKPIPVGVIIPFLLSILSFGAIACLTFLQTNIEATPARVAKRRGGARRFAEVTEWHHAAIPAAGIGANLIFALLFYIFFRNIPLVLDIAKFSVYYSMWNLLPLGQLDGTKILFGSRILWLFLVIISLIFTLISVFLI